MSCLPCPRVWDKSAEARLEASKGSASSHHLACIQTAGTRAYVWEGVTALLGWSVLFPSVSSAVLWGVTTVGRNEKEISRTQKSSIGPV